VKENVVQPSVLWPKGYPRTYPHLIRMAFTFKFE